MNTICQSYFEEVEAIKAPLLHSAQWKSYDPEMAILNGKFIERQEFFEMLLELPSLIECVYHLRETTYDLANEPQPDAVLSHFWFISTAEQAMTVAMAFKLRFGAVALCRAESVEIGEPVTLLDLLMLDDGNLLEETSLELMREAFLLAGFKRAMDVNENVLIDFFCSDVYHIKFIKDLWECDYEAIRNDNGWIFRELVQHLFHPNRVNKWLEVHPECDVENYII